jgi:hypothetical protein
MKKHHRFKFNRTPKLSAISVALSAIALTNCTTQVPDEFALQQQNETFSGQTKVQINTKIDMLWVVDNSSSMDTEQQRLRQGFAAFALKYMQPTWDIQVAAIPTDLYMASDEFSAYRVLTLVQGLEPQWGAVDGGGNPTYSQLLPGIHDGPISSSCSVNLPYFYYGATQCMTRQSSGNTSKTTCSASDDFTECVNTASLNTIHTNQPIIKTMPPAGTPGDQGWVNTITSQFITNLSTGSAGDGSERGMQSVLQLIHDNEKTGSLTPFFRPGSTRVIIFVSDEEDQTMNPEATGVQVAPFQHYMCDIAQLTAQGDSTGICGSGGGATYQDLGARLPQPGASSSPLPFLDTSGHTTCKTNMPSNAPYAPGTSSFYKQIAYNDSNGNPISADGTYAYNIGVCPNPDYLMPVSTVKSKLDTFFNGLDGTTGTNNSYFVVSIVPWDATSVQAISGTNSSGAYITPATARHADDVTVNTASSGDGLIMQAVDRGDRYIQLGQQVGNGSFTMDLSSSDYSPILDAIGNEITAQKGTFTLQVIPKSKADVIVEIVHADGSMTVIPAANYSISGKTLTITDLNTVLSFVSTDQIVINYQPGSSV